MSERTRYPAFNVMEHKNNWDPHTQQIVSSRLIREHEYRFLHTEEAETLRAICAMLAGDDRGEIIQYVVCQIDETLLRNVGEGQRKAGLPEIRRLVREGMAALDACAQSHYLKPFFMLEETVRQQMLTDVSHNQLEPQAHWQHRAIPQKAWFQKMLAMTVEGYFSHPDVWSEIGYAGPAYPRGYVRADIGMLDPWEANAES